MMLLLIFFGFLCQNTFGIQIQKCKTAEYSGTVVATDENWNPGPTTYWYKYEMKLSIDSGNVTYPNIITLSNFTEWSSNSSVYYRTTPVEFEYGLHGEEEFSINWTSLNETWSFFFPNGLIWSSFIFKYSEAASNIFPPLIFINKGIFISTKFYMLDQNFCVFGDYEKGDHVIFKSEICCKEYDYVGTPFIPEDKCTELSSTTTLIDNEYPTNITMTVNYDISRTEYSTVFNFTTNMISALSDDYNSYEFQIDGITFFSGNTSAPTQFYEKNINDSVWNMQLDFMLRIHSNPPPPKYVGIDLGGIIIKNGTTIIKNNYKPFTVNDPCVTKSSGVPFSSSSATYKSSLCCTKFEGTASASTTPTTTTIPSTPPTTTNPKSNFIGAPCSNDTFKAWLDIVFVIDTSKAITKRELYQLSAEISTYMLNFTFAQSGNHTVRAAIIGYASDVTTYYELPDTTNYDDFVNALFDFADHGNSDDPGGNLQGGLQQAYNLLIAQKSQRRPLIVLIAAAYSPSGFQGADTTADAIKQNGICIVVINFATSQGVLATALQGIACSGYYYISNDTDLNLKFPYALAQLNCICPPGSLQFRVENTAWQNHTNYADCFFGFNLATAPRLAEKACRPGVLVALTSKNKLDFITDHVLSYVMPKEKKFTIGLHKSDIDGEWKWWGYNQTEYSLGDYPAMSDIPGNGDNYGYMWNHYGFNWALQTGNNVALPYICQLRACDAEYICDQTQTKKLGNFIQEGVKLH